MRPHAETRQRADRKRLFKVDHGPLYKLLSTDGGFMRETWVNVLRFRSMGARILVERHRHTMCVDSTLDPIAWTAYGLRRLCGDLQDPSVGLGSAASMCDRLQAVEF
jgi:hypothetical protein